MKEEYIYTFKYGGYEHNLGVPKDMDDNEVKKIINNIFTDLKKCEGTNSITVTSHFKIKDNLPSYGEIINLKKVKKVE
ncbi:MAG: hypothetical protein KKH98_14270 [Spirochaetes bacterium]|nr:hypothetical protein [Spirochaetota bacterium]